MKKEHLSLKIATGAQIITALSFLIGGHLLAAHFLLSNSFEIIEFALYVVIGIVGINIIYFLGSLIVASQSTKHRRFLIKSALLMLINIPIAILFMIILFAYES